MNTKTKKENSENVVNYTQQVKENFVRNGMFFICGEIDETLPYTIIAPLIREIKKRMIQTNPQPIEFYITSDGGYLDMAFDLITWFEHAKNCGVEIHTYVTSVAFSAASLIAVSGHHRFGSVRAYHGLHFARGYEYSHNPLMSDRNNENMKFLQAELIKVYQNRTKLEDIEGKLIADNFMVNGGEDLLKFGLIDELIENPFEKKLKPKPKAKSRSSRKK